MIGGGLRGRTVREGPPGSRARPVPVLPQPCQLCGSCAMSCLWRSFSPLPLVDRELHLNTARRCVCSPSPADVCEPVLHRPRRGLRLYRELRTQGELASSLSPHHRPAQRPTTCQCSWQVGGQPAQTVIGCTVPQPRPQMVAGLGVRRGPECGRSL